MPTSGFGPAERELFEEQASKLYQDTVLVGRVAQDDPRLAEDAAERPAFDLLVTLGLLVPDTAGESFVRKLERGYVFSTPSRVTGICL